MDSLNEPNNPIIVNGRKLFQQEPKLVDMIKMTALFMLPSLTKYFNMEMTDEPTQFFTKLSEDIMKQKRAEFAKLKDGSATKASSFIEFMLEAEEEGKKMEEAEKENGENGGLKKPTKCKIF